MHFLKHSDALLIATELIDYEIGQPLEARAIPMRLAVLLGAREVLFLSEMYAFGGEGDHIKSGNLLLATDHYNFAGVSPVIGPHVKEFGERFYDIHEQYNLGLREKVRTIVKQKVTVHEGEVLWMSSMKPHGGVAEERFASYSE